MCQRRVLLHAGRALILLGGILLCWKIVWLVTSVDVNEVESKIDKIGTAANPVLVQVYYESMCPDSKYFIREQLVPTVRKIPEIINFELVPYGKASTFENGTGIFFQCQHRERECVGNKIHACAIRYIEDNTKLLHYASCLFENLYDPESVAQDCAVANAVDWEPIQRCAGGVEGSELLKKYGEMTARLSPRVSFIPTVTLNGLQGVQGKILKDLVKEVCNAYQEDKPVGCSS